MNEYCGYSLQALGLITIVKHSRTITRMGR